MAEIHVEPKKQTSSSSWIWIVLVLLLAAVAVYYFMTRNNTTNDTVQPTTPTSYLGVPLHSFSNTAFL